MGLTLFLFWIRDVFCTPHLGALGYTTHLESHFFGAVLTTDRDVIICGRTSWASSEAWT